MKKDHPKKDKTVKPHKHAHKDKPVKKPGDGGVTTEDEGGNPNVPPPPPPKP